MSASKKLPPHLHEFEGDLWREKQPTPLRRKFAWHFREISQGKELCACLRAGEFAWPGGYTCYFIASDGEALSFETVRKNLRRIIDSIRCKSGDGWRVVGLECEANTEGRAVYCAHSGKLICGEIEKEGGQ